MADYRSGSGTSLLLFRYRVGRDRYDPDGLQLFTTPMRLGAGDGVLANNRIIDALPSSAWNNAAIRSNNQMIDSRNKAPAFPSDSVTVTLEELAGFTVEALGRAVGDPLVATDPNVYDAGQVTYSLAESSVKFALTNVTEIGGSSSGVLATKAGQGFDYESGETTYNLRVTARDPGGLEDSVDVTVNISDVDEPPLAPDPPTVDARGTNPYGLNVSWDAPDNRGRPPITHYDVRVWGQATDGLRWVETESTDRVEQPWPLGPGLYPVQVRAVNAEGDGAWSDVVETALNQVPTGADKTVTVLEDGSHTFSAADFGFSDGDSIHVLTSVTIATVPGAGSLELSGSAVTANQEVAAADIGSLVFTPAANANGSTYASFTFKVSDGISASAAANTLTFDVTAVNDPATGAPTISGFARVGQILTADVSAIADEADGLPALATFAYQWLRVDGASESEIGGATDSTYTVMDAHIGKRVKVRVSFTDLDGHDEALVSAAYPSTGQVAADTAPTGADRTVTLPEDGSHTFSAADFGFSDGDGDTLASVTIATVPDEGSLALSGSAVTANQEVAAADIGSLVYTPAANANGSTYASFTFRVADGFSASAAANTLTFDVTAVNDPATGAPTISGFARVGQILTADVSAIGDEADGLPALATFAYQWLRVDGASDSEIGGATDSTYTVMDADIGKRVKVRVSFTDLDGHDEALVSAAYPSTGQVAADTAPTGADRTVTLPEDGSHTFSAADFGFSDGDGDTLASVTIATVPDEGSLALSGSAVTANQEVAAADIGSLVYTPAANANGSAYASFTFRVADGFSASAAANTVTLDVTAVNDPATGAPTVSGSVEVGEELTAGAGDIADVDGLPTTTMPTGYTFQWMRFDADGTSNPTPIPGATAHAYTLVPADTGKKVKVKIGFTDRQSNVEERTSRAWPTRGTVEDATLSGLTVSEGTLKPAFAPAQAHYIAGVRIATSRVTVTPTTTDPHASVAYFNPKDTIVVGRYHPDGTPLAPIEVKSPLADADASSRGTFEVDLALGRNVFMIEVTGRYGVAKRTYTLEITRGPLISTLSTDATLSALGLSEGTLSPAFTPAQTSYVARVQPSTSRITVTPSMSDTGATIAWRDAQGAALADADTNAAGFQVNLASGSDGTLFKMQVTAPDGQSRTYEVTVYRNASGCGAAQAGELWCGEMTVAKKPKSSRVYGYYVGHPGVDPHGSLSPKNFTHRGVTARVSEIVIDRGKLRFRTSIPNNGGPRGGFYGDDDYVLEIGTGANKKTFDISSPGAGTSFSFEDTQGLSWGAGDRVLLRLKSVQEMTLAPPVVVGAPVIESYGTRAADGWSRGEVVNVHVTFDKAVYVSRGNGTNPPSIGIELGGVPGNARRAQYIIGSGTTSLRFDYQLQPGDGTHHAMKVTADSLSENGGVIMGNDSPNPAALLGHASAFVVAPSLPCVSYDNEFWCATLTVGGTGATGFATSGSGQGSLSIAQVSYGGTSYSIEGLTYDAGQQQVQLSFGQDGAAAVFNMAGFTLHLGTRTYAFPASTIDSTEKTVTWTGITDGWSANDEVFVRLTGPPGSGQQVEVTTPAVESFGIGGYGGDGNWSSGNTLKVELTFDEAVVVDTTHGTPHVQAAFGFDLATRRDIPYANGSGTTTLAFEYTLESGDGSHNSMFLFANSLAANGGTIRSAANGGDAILEHNGGNEIGTSSGTRSDDTPRVSIVDLPENHDGQSGFTLRMRFSGAPAGLSPKRDAASVVEVEGGTVTGATAETKDADSPWLLTVEPDGNADVTVRVPVRECTEPGAVCIGGEPLARAAEATVPGPPALPAVSIAASATPVTEGTAAAFTLTRTGAADEALTVTVSVRESASVLDGAAPETATFEAGSDTASLTVATSDDRVAEAASTVTATVAAGEGYTVDGTSGSARVVVEDNDEAPVCPAPALTGGAERVWTGRLGIAKWPDNDYYGFGNGVRGTLDDRTFTLGANDYLVDHVTQRDGSGGSLLFSLESSLSADEKRTLTLHVCGGTPLPFADASGPSSHHTYTWTNTGLDWSGHAERTLYLTRDAAAPAFTSASVDGAALTVTFGEALDAGARPAASAFAVTVAGSARTVGSVAVAGSTVTLTLASEVTAGDTVTVAYTAPDEPDAGLQDGSGNRVAGFAAADVTNATAAAVPVPSLPSVSIAASATPVTEGTAASFTLTRTGATDAALTVTVSVQESASALGGAAPETVTFEAGSATASLTLATSDDEVAEAASTVTAALVAGEGYTVDGASGSAGVAVQDDDDAPVVTAASPLEVAENATAVATLAATDADTPAGELVWSIPAGAAGGADAAQFELTAGGVLTFGTAKDYESPDDADTDGEYELTVRVTDGANPVEAPLTVRLVDVDEAAPAFTSASVDGAALTVTFGEALDAGARPAASAFAVTVAGSARTVESVAVAGSTVTLTLASEVTAGDTVTVAYTAPDEPDPGLQDGSGNRVAGFAAADVTNATAAAVPVPSLPSVSIAASATPVTEGTAASFTLTRTGATDAALTVTVSVQESASALGGAAPETVTFEAGSATASLTLATSDDEVAEAASTVTAALVAGEGYTVDGASGSAGVAVQDDDDAPVVTAASPLEVAENATAVATLAATDADTPAGELVWSIPAGAAGGADAAQFELTAGGVLTFGTAKDYESPDDADTDGEYELTVRVTDGANPVEAPLTVRLVDVDEAPGQQETVRTLWSTTMTWQDVGHGWYGGYDTVFADPEWTEDGTTYRIWYIDYHKPRRELRFTHDGSGGRIRNPDELSLRIGGYTVGPGEAMTAFAGARTGTVSDIDSHWSAGEEIAIELVRRTLPTQTAQSVPVVTVADVRVTEAPGASVDFTVTLSPAPTSAVTLRYATADGSARAGDDYGASSGTLTFAAGETTRTVSVAVFDDVIDDGRETFTLHLSNPADARIADARATATIDNADPMPQAWLTRFGRAASDNVIEAVSRRWEGGAQAAPETRFTLGGRRVDALFGGFGAIAGVDTGQPRSARETPDDSDVGLAEESAWARMDRMRNEMHGHTGPAGGGPAGGGLAHGGFSGQSFAANAPAYGRPANGASASGNPGGASPGVGDLSVGNPSGGGRGGQGARWREALDAVTAAGGDARWARWLRQGGALLNGHRAGLRDVLLNSSFRYSPQSGEGNRGRSGGPGWLGDWAAWGETASTHFSGAEDALSLDGEVATGVLGFDSRRGRWLTGVAVSYTEAAGAYSHRSLPGGALKSTLAGLHPYAHFELGDRTRLWGVLGYGAGELTLTPDGAEGGIDTGLRNTTAAFGGRTTLSVAARRAGRFELAVRSDVRYADIESATVANLRGASGATSRVRAVLEGAGTLSLAGGATLSPTLEAGLRYDGGDAETGAGVEVGAGLGYAAGRLSVQVNARGLVAHEDAEYEEWGFSGSVAYTPGADGLGLRLQLGSSWGAAHSGVNALWSRESANGLARGLPMHGSQRYQAELGYGLAGRKAQALWHPFVGLESSHAGAGALRAGFRLSAGEHAEMGLSLQHSAGRGDETHYGLELAGRIRW